jgi:HD-GYP domain-containing protein (c-di-GMP phosphodiesterase class II)
LAARFCHDAARLLAWPATEAVWPIVLALEPGAPRALSDAQLDTALRAMADFVDLKSPYFGGHSSGVADLAAAAAQQGGLPPAATVTIWRAGLLHDLGRVGISSALWDKPGPLTDDEWEWVRLHSYYTEGVLSRASVFAPLAAVAALHHERLDGSGYHRSLPGTLLNAGARLLAAADAYHALTEPRPHRAALTPEAAAAILRREVHAGRIAGEAAGAVLAVRRGGLYLRERCRQRSALESRHDRRDAGISRTDRFRHGLPGAIQALPGGIGMPDAGGGL